MRTKLLQAVFTLSLITMPFVGFCDDKTVAYEQLPDNIKQFVSKHFSEETVSCAQQEQDEYELYLSNGTKLEFNRSGAWKQIKSRQAAIPQSLLALIPKVIVDYFEKNYPDKHIYEIQVERNGYEVILNDAPDKEYKFNKKGEFVRIDE